MYKIYLSPSTQEKNIRNDNGTEETYCNHVADLIEKELKLYHQVEVCRNAPEMTLHQVVDDSNAHKVDLHLAIHTNAMGVKNTAQGCEVFVHRFGSDAERFGSLIYKYISELTPWKDRGLKESYKHLNGKPLYEPAYTTAPCALVEIDFHDNTKSLQWLMNNAQSIADALVKSILEYLEIMPFDMCVLKDVTKINAYLEIKKIQSLNYDYWTNNSKLGKLIPGEYCAELLKRIAQSL
jgi:N-acetylmuramoyl-L-alanine amidase